MERQCDFINEVHLTGQIKHIHRNFEKRVAGIEVATYGGHPNYPEVLCLGDHFADADTVAVGDWVKITACVQTRRKRIQEGDSFRTDYRQGLVLTNIEKTESIGEKYFGQNAENGLYDTQNLVVLTGTVNSFKALGNRAQLTLYCMNGKYRDLIMVAFFTQDAKEFVSQFEKGDWVNVVARVQTTSASKSNTGHKKESLVGARINKVADASSVKEDGNEK